MLLPIKEQSGEGTNTQNTTTPWPCTTAFCYRLHEILDFKVWLKATAGAAFQTETTEGDFKTLNHTEGTKRRLPFGGTGQLFGPRRYPVSGEAHVVVRAGRRLVGEVRRQQRRPVVLDDHGVVLGHVDGRRQLVVSWRRHKQFFLLTRRIFFIFSETAEDATSPTWLTRRARINNRWCRALVSEIKGENIWCKIIIQ